MLPETQTARYETQDRPLFEQKVQELCPDCDILYQNADQDPTKQQSQVEAAVTEGVDVIVLDPVDSTSAAGMVTRAQQADIPVISYDRLILDADLAAYAEFNSPEVGQQQAEALVEALAEGDNPEGPIVQINGDPKDNNATLFKEGATQVFEDEGVEVAAEYDTPDWLPENAQKEMDQAITSVGKDGFHGVLAANDGTAGGVIAALKGAGLDPSSIPVTGQDAELAAIQRILAGEQYMTVYKPIKPLADNAATLAVAVVNGEDPAESEVINGEEDNGTEQVPTAITDTIPVFADNVADTVVQDEYWTAQDICTKEYEQACKDAGIE
jgi:D-xylose transport system substrate-binding protein